MVVIAVLAAGVGAGAVALATLWARRARTDGEHALAIERALGDLRLANQQAIADLRTQFVHTLGASEQQVLTQTGTTQRTLGDLSRQLGTLGEQSARIGELAKDIGSLHELLRSPKLRGGFGELLMQRVLEDALPAEAFELQHTYADGSRVDAVVRFAGRLVPIDAKFPLESFNALAAAGDDADRRAKRRIFMQQARRHVDAVAKYIVPADGTIDYAFMYIPAENIYYEAVVRPDTEFDLHAYCAQRRVVPASPNTLMAYLQLVSFGLRGLAVQERTRDLQQGIEQLVREVERFRTLHEQLGRHLENATKKHAESERAFGRVAIAIENLARAPLPSAAEQEALPIGTDDAIRYEERVLPFVRRDE